MSMLRRTLRWMIAAAVASLPIHGSLIYAADGSNPIVFSTIENPAADWNLIVSLNHPDGRYLIGDAMQIRVESAKKCYLHIINVNPNGEISVLWPLEGQGSNLVEPGAQVAFPPKIGDTQFRFEATAPVGKEHVVCLATSTPLNLRQKEDMSRFDNFLSSVSASKAPQIAKLRAFVTKIERNASDWTAKLISIETLAAAESTPAQQPAKPEAPATTPAGAASSPSDLPKPETIVPEVVKPEGAKPEAPVPEPTKPEQPKPEEPKPEEPKPAEIKPEEPIVPEPIKEEMKPTEPGASKPTVEGSAGQTNDPCLPKINIGSKQIVTPNPTGMVAWKENRAQFIERLEGLYKGTIRLHEVYEPTDDAKKANGVERHGELQTIIKAEGKMSRDEFEALKHDAPAAIQDRFNAGLEPIPGVEVLVSTARKAEPEIIACTSEAQVSVHTYQVNSFGGSKVERVCASAICWVNGELVIMALHSDFESDDDKAWVKKTAVDWAHDIILANAK